VGWLKPRLRDVTISTGLAVLSAIARGNRVELKLSDGSHEMVDHVLMATGYRVDVRKYEFLSGSLVSALRLIDGHLVLGRGFESSVPGLHFLGAPAVWSYGPLMRFVAGADLAARAVARSVVCARRPAVGRPVTDTLQTPQSVIVPSIEINTLQGQLPHPRTKGAETTLASSSRAGR
jgi:hypothetical protein